VRNCSAAAPQKKKKATSSKASQKLSTNDVFAGESQTKKNYKEKKQEDWRKFRKRQQRERRSVAGTKRTETSKEREDP
jgi:hypothetical protein